MGVSPVAKTAQAKNWLCLFALQDVAKSKRFAFHHVLHANRQSHTRAYRLRRNIATPPRTSRLIVIGSGTGASAKAAVAENTLGPSPG